VHPKILPKAIAMPINTQSIDAIIKGFASSSFSEAGRKHMSKLTGKELIEYIDKREKTMQGLSRAFERIVAARSKRD